MAIGLFASVSDHGSVVVALPSISNHFDTDLPTTQWVLIGYALTISALLLPMGRMADIVGRKRVYVLGFVIFTVGALAAGLSPSVEALIASKIFQGVGAAMTQGTSMAMVVSTFPPEQRGKALGLQMSMVGLGGVAGPAVGGFLIDVADWRWVFFGGSIMGAVSVLAAIIIIDSKQVGQPTGDREAFDWLGAALSTGAMVSFLLGMTGGQRLGWLSPLILAGLVHRADDCFRMVGASGAVAYYGHAIVQAQVVHIRSVGELPVVCGHVIGEIPDAFLSSGRVGILPVSGRSHDCPKRFDDDNHGAAERQAFGQIRRQAIHNGWHGRNHVRTDRAVDAHSEFLVHSGDGGNDDAELWHRHVQRAK